MQIGDDRKQKDFFLKYKDINRKMEESQAAAQAQGLGLEYIDLSKFPVDLNALALMTKDQINDTKAAVFYKDGNDLRLGVLDPRNEMLNKQLVEFEKEKFKPKLYY